MKILRVIGSTNPAGGGPMEGMLRSTAALARLGHETEIACLDRPGDPWLANLGVPVAPLGQFTRRYGFSFRFMAWMAANAGRYDVAILHGIWNFSSVGAWLALKRTRTPYAIFTHGMMDPWFREAFPLKHAVKDLYWAALESRVLRDAACVLFTSEDERRLARGLFPKATYDDAVVSYGTADAPAPGSATLCSFLPELAGRRYLLFLSRIHPKKGCDLALRALAAVAADQPDLDLVIAGPDQAGWSAELRRLAKELGVGGRVHWPGMLSGEPKWAAFREAEAFLLPSHSENFGIVVAEALACGASVLTTHKVNIWREVEACGAGMVTTDDEAGVTAMVRSFLALSPDARAAMRAAARPCFLQNFDIDRAAEMLAERLEAIAGGRDQAAAGTVLPVNRPIRAR